jgi:hypothetical protein
MLAQWIKHHHQCSIPVSTMIIQAKVKSLFEKVNATEKDPKVQAFVTSAGRFECFKGCHGFHNLKLTGKALVANLVAAEKLPVLLQVTVKRHGYLPQQMFDLDDRQKAACQRLLHHFFKGVESCQSTGFARELVQPEHAPHSPASTELPDKIICMY